MAFVKEPPNIPDLGLGYIATSLMNNGHQAYIRDWNMESSVDSFRVWLEKYQPELIGIKVFTKDVWATKKTISIIRKSLPEVTVVIGGPHASAVDPVRLMEDFTKCDFAIKGEAEISFPSLLTEISERKKNSDRGFINKTRAIKISGLVWRDKDGVFANPISLCHDLNKFKFPPWEIMDPNNYNINMLGSEKEGATAPIITTRGCPGKCTFCSAHNISGRKIRSRSPENVFKEMSILYSKYGVKKFMFMDNCFTANKKHLKVICKMIINDRMNVEWDCSSYENLENLTDEMLALMYDAGCRMIHIGIESGSEHTRKEMNKLSDLSDIDKKIKLIKKDKIKIGAWFMIGFPEETKKEMNKTIKYAFSLNPDLLTFTIAYPLPGTQIYNYIKDKYKFQNIDWSNFDIYNSEYPLSELSSKKLTWLLKTIRFRIRIHSKLKRISGILIRK
jgi:radical SAM superfamily enzyme YgiQ (UPF0313 family)